MQNRYSQNRPERVKGVGVGRIGLVGAGVTLGMAASVDATAWRICASGGTGEAFGPQPVRIAETAKSPARSGYLVIN